MALQFNPQTGQMEDDGQPEDPRGALIASGALPRPQPGPPSFSPEPALPLPPPAPMAPAPTLPAPAPAPLPTLPASAPAPRPAVAAPAMPKLPGGPAAPNERQLRGDLTSIQAEQERVAAQKGDLGIQRAGVEQNVADQQLQMAQEAEQRRAALEQQTEAEVAKRQGVLDAEAERYKSMGFKDFWSRATIGGKEGTVTGARILGAISMALGAAGASLAHTPNFAMDMIDKAIDRDYQMQRDSIMKQKDVVTEARMGVEGARQAKADALLKLKNWEASAHAQAAAQVMVMQAKMGVPTAEADKNALVLDQRQKSFDKLQELSKGVATLANITADTTLKRAEAQKARAEAAAKGTEGQDDKGRAAGKQIELATMASQMHDDAKVLLKTGFPTPATLQTLQNNETALKAVSESHGVKGVIGTMAGRATGIVPKNRMEGIPDDQQRAVNSWDLLSKKAATVLSGQGHQNVESTMAMMMPKAGDTPDLIRQKFDNLMHIADNAQVLSGKYGQRIEAADAARGQAAPAVAPSAPRQLDTVTRARLLEKLHANPNDPRAGEVRALLGM